MQQRHEAVDSLDDFCTPPWATRALFNYVVPMIGGVPAGRAWEPACNRGHMVKVLREYYHEVVASDERVNKLAKDATEIGKKLDGLGIICDRVERSLKA